MAKLKFKPGDKVIYNCYFPTREWNRVNESQTLSIPGTVLGYDESFNVIIKPDHAPLLHFNEDQVELDTIEQIKNVMKD